PSAGGGRAGGRGPGAAVVGREKRGVEIFRRPPPPVNLPWPGEDGRGPVLLIVMYESQTWRVRPGELFTFGRAPDCSAVLPAADRGVSRRAGSFRFRDGLWWLGNDSSSCVLGVLGDRGFRADLPPGVAVPLQQWQAKVTLAGALGRYTLRLRLPGLDDVPDPALQPPRTGEHA